MFDTWTCHVCGQERPNDKISVATGSIPELPGAEINIRYCNDNLVCETKAKLAAKQGKFPETQKVNIDKKWWEFWK
jgi:hypothetical protein